MEMEHTAILPTAAPRAKRAGLSGCLGALFNLLALFFVVLTLLAGLLIAAVFSNPQLLAVVPGGSQLLPVALPGLAQLPDTPTPDAASGEVGTSSLVYPTLPPEWTATDTPTVTLTPVPATITPTPTETRPGPTITPSRTPTRTPTATLPGPTLTPSATRAPFNFVLQNSEPTYLANFINTAGCDWFGIAGQVFGLDNRPVIGLTIHVEGGGLSVDALTGSQPGIGPGGYEIPLGNHPVTTTDTYRVQLRNNTGTPLSDNLIVPTHGDCTKNLVLVNFVQNH